MSDERCIAFAAIQREREEKRGNDLKHSHRFKVPISRLVKRRRKKKKKKLLTLVNYIKRRCEFVNAKV